MKQITVTITVDILTPDEMPPSLKTVWFTSARDGGVYSLEAGAGVGSRYLTGHATGDGRHAYARADMEPVAQQIFEALAAEITQP